MSLLLLKLKTFYRYHIKGRWAMWQTGSILQSQAVPVVVYTMAKVGSTSVAYSVHQQTSYPVFHIHSMQQSSIDEAYRQCRQKGWWPDSRQPGALIKKDIIDKNRPVKIICTIREPIARNISAFFEVLPFYTGHNDYSVSTDMQVLTDTFMQQLPHRYPLEWLQYELGASLGINVYDYPFDIDKKFILIKQGNIELLIVRTDLDDAEKSMHIAQLLDCPAFQLVNRNEGAKKAYASLYQRFKSHITLPASYIDTMLQSDYARHFFSEAERHTIKKRWQKT